MDGPSGLSRNSHEAFLSSHAILPQCAPKFDRTLGAVTIDMGGFAMRFRPDNPSFGEALSNYYAGFVNPGVAAWCHFDVSLRRPPVGTCRDLRVSNRGALWRIERGSSFLAEWNSGTRQGWMFHEPNLSWVAYSIDAVLRTAHQVLLAEEGGFLLHASSVVRNGRAFLFAGVSGAGKTTIAHLAPQDAILLTDEISYVKRHGNEYCAHGTPFTSSDCQRRGRNISAPIAAVYLLGKGAENRFESVDRATAARALLRNVLLALPDSELANRLFESAIAFVSRVPVVRLIFAPDERVWDLIV